MKNNTFMLFLKMLSFGEINWDDNYSIKLRLYAMWNLCNINKYAKIKISSW